MIMGKYINNIKDYLLISMVFNKRIQNGFLFLMVGAIALTSCSAPNKQEGVKEASAALNSKSPLQKLEWLLGYWSNETKGQMIGENWLKENDSLFQGFGYGLKEQDTIFRETLQITLLDNEIYYVPTVSGQNDNQPVLFRIIEIGENYFISENKNHDFPQIIRYELESPGVLLAVIEGNLNGKATKREFRFRKSTVRLMP